MKNCRVIGTGFTEREDRHRFSERQYWWPAHIQFGVGPEGVLQMMKDTCSLEMDVDAGVELDTIIINSVTGFEEGNAFLRDMNNVKTKCGKFITLEKTNIGGQFGAYEFAYQTFKNDYDFWLFTEDDILITGYKYYLRLLEKLGIRRFQTAYALAGLVDNHPHIPPHACSACLLVYKDILEKMKHLPFPSSNDLKLRIFEGEVAFSTKIYEAGYDIVYEGPGINESHKWSFGTGETKEWPYEQDYCLPYRELIDNHQSVDNFKKGVFYTG